jgi:peptidoglycan/LPS O-acetylase OafA/YrhL
MFYAQDLLRSRGVPGYFGIVSVGWTLCLEVQFYLALITLLALGRWARRRGGGGAEAAVLATVLVPLTAYSLYVWFSAKTFEFFGMWFMFASGVVLCWTLLGRTRQRWLWLLVGAVALLGCWRADGRAVASATTVSAIYAAALTGQMSRWLGGRVMQYLGRISYSLYLSHMAVGVLAITLLWDKGDKSTPLAVVAYAVACAAAIAAADLLHRLIEAPCVRLAKRLKPAAAPRRTTVGAARPAPDARGITAPADDHQEPVIIAVTA